MGAECCTASSNNKHEQIIAQKTDQTLDEEPNEQAKKQIQQKQIEETTLKTSFYGSAGVACSKTMTAQKNSHIEKAVKDYKGTSFITSGNILSSKDAKPLENIKQEVGEDEMTKVEKVEPSKTTKAATKLKEQKHQQISTAQLIDQQAGLYMEGMTNDLKDSKKRQ